MDQTVTAVAIATAIAGFIAPFIIPIINRPSLSDNTKRLISLGVALALALIALAVTGGFALGPAGVGAVILAVIGLTQTVFALLVKPTGISDKIEQATTPHPQP